MAHPINDPICTCYNNSFAHVTLGENRAQLTFPKYPASAGLGTLRSQPSLFICPLLHSMLFEGSLCHEFSIKQCSSPRTLEPKA